MLPRYGADQFAGLFQILGVHGDGLGGRWLVLVGDELLPFREASLNVAQLYDRPVVFLALLKVFRGFCMVALASVSHHGLRVDDQIIVRFLQLVCERAGIDGKRCLAVSLSFALDDGKPIGVGRNEAVRAWDEFDLDGCDDAPGGILASPGGDGSYSLGVDSCSHGSS